MMALQHISIVKHFSGCPELKLDDAVVAKVKHQFPGLWLTCLESSHSFFCGDI
jgi:hypothetical protein